MKHVHLAVIVNVINMTEYQKKNLLDEHKYIGKKLNKQNMFINSKEFLEKDKAIQEAIEKQRKGMVQYEYWLTKRLELENIEYDTGRVDS